LRIYFWKTESLSGRPSCRRRVWLERFGEATDKIDRATLGFSRRPSALERKQKKGHIGGG
jgi:hypothetical protein